MPASGAEVVPAPPVLDGELLSEQENATLAALLSRRGRSQLRAVADSRWTAQFTAVAAYRLRVAPWDAARLCWFALRGHARWIAKGWTWATHGDLRADARAARLIGDREARRAAQELIRADAAARWAKLGIAAHRIALGGLLIALLGGILTIVNAYVDRADMWPWLAGLYTVLGVLGAMLPWLLKAAPIGWLVAAIWEGRDRVPGAGFLLHPDRDDPDPWIDERMVTTALATLNIAPLNRFFKDGGQVVYTIPARRDGSGTAVQLRMPLGTKASDVIARKELLAANLGRLEVETWPSVGPQANILDLWVADQGALDGPPPPWPLLHHGTVDVYDGVPWGVTIRGEPITAPLIGTNWLFGALAGQGKTATMRLLALGVALDVSTEIRIVNFKPSGDWNAFTPRASVLLVGMGADVITACADQLEWLVTDMQRRAETLERHAPGANKVPKHLAARKDLGLHPLFLFIDEVHILFGDEQVGGKTGRATVAMKALLNMARAFNLHLIIATQRPDDRTLPAEVRDRFGMRACLHVGNEATNDMILGKPAFADGGRATDLRYNTDRGTCVVNSGFGTNTKYTVVRTHYVSAHDPETHTPDQVTPIITRAMHLITKQGRTIHPALEHTTDKPVPVDHLADIHRVLHGERRVRTQVVLTRLAELNPATYEGWSFSDLKTALAHEGIEIGKSHGHSVVRADDITQTITQRHDNDDRKSDDDRGN
ncbi:MAG TPA: AAA family ATPase [Pseudonocardiaceae bacterium]|nr:AAA family ATPase [Pseudonocardiaceae bacterium]